MAINEELVSNIPDSTASIETPTQAQERMLSQSAVKKIAAQEKEEGYLRGKKEAEQEYQRKLAELQQQDQSQAQRNETVPRQVDADAIYQQVQEKWNSEMQRRQLEQEMSQVANNYLAKMDLGRKEYGDFDTVTGDFDPTAFPQLTYLVSGIENAGDVVYELSKNPSKLVTLDTLAQRSPKHARAELLKLSQSIAANKTAAVEAESNGVAAPLDQLQPSRISGSNGKLSISDLRKQDYLRG